MLKKRKCFFGFVKNIAADRTGDTMISVMIAFVMLLMGIVIIMQASQAALKLMNYSDEIRKEEQLAMELHYRPGESSISQGDIEAKVDSEGSGSSIVQIGLKQNQTGESTINLIQVSYDIQKIIAENRNAVSGSSREYFIYKFKDIQEGESESDELSESAE